MTAIRIDEIRFGYEDFRYRAPFRFGGVAVDRVTLVNVHCRVSTRAGKSAVGFGSMPLGNVWAFPSRTLPYDATLSAMKAVVTRIAAEVASFREYGHPIDVARQLEPAIDQAATGTVPVLAKLVCASPFDAAIHDAFGKVHGVNCYQTYGRDFLQHDLDYYLGPEYRGMHLGDFLDCAPRANLPVNHTVGALDPLEECDLRQRLNDGLPELLSEWISVEGLTHFKLKLNGDDLRWDVDRVVAVERAAAIAQHLRGCAQWWYTLDFNERCRNVAYLLEFLRKLEERAPAALARIQYIEQPTGRDLAADSGNVMHEAAKICPVVIDEALVDLESLRLAQEMGYTGVAIKACKGQSQSLLLAAAARHAGMFLCVQDLTCPGAALIQSAGLAAHVPGVAAIEANARQYVPAANAGWEERFPGIFCIQNGVMATGQLTGPGLSAVI
ncbi:MAG TPA: enolase C-terminal domain-like protein [Gemmataceae bacterium]|nr:enolase C-terminal domain-like protein [Gemmataceae bacterium]